MNSLINRTPIHLTRIRQVLMEGTPPSLNYTEIKQLFLNIDGIRRVHNLRVWNLSSNKIALSAHLAIGTQNTTPAVRQDNVT